MFAPPTLAPIAPRNARNPKGAADTTGTSTFAGDTTYGNIFTGRHRHGGDQPSDTRDQYIVLLRSGYGNADDQARGLAICRLFNNR